MTGIPARSQRGTPGAPYAFMRSGRESMRLYIHVRASGPSRASNRASSAAASGLR